MNETINPKRIQKINELEYQSGKILYWMSRDQRVDNNWSLIFAQELAKENNEELIVVFNLVPEFLDATLRQYDFMLKGLEKIEGKLEKLNINFEVLLGDTTKNISNYITENNIGLIITDFDPLRIKKQWQEEISQNIKIPLFLVDSHNIVPIWQASPKSEFGAYTLRPKIQKQLADFLTEFPKTQKQNEKIRTKKNQKNNKINWEEIYNSIKVDKNVKPIEWIIPGEEEAQKILKEFIETKLDKYSEFRNDPTKNYQSNLSPYLHFGQISSQQIALEISRSGKNETSIEEFLDELIIRKELADNYCYYNENYGDFNSLPNWAKGSLSEHRFDKREYLYSLEEFENAKTHEELWNAAQIEMIKTGKMHGYMRMYWAKKILEWSKNPKEAIEIAIYLNDKYSIDGRDPNGYAGIMWSIGGLHDRAWFERQIFGKIRYMNLNGCKKKFNVEKYIEMNNK